MSQAQVRDLTGSKAGQGLDAMLSDLPGMLSTAATQYVDLLRRSSRFVSGLLPANTLSSLTSSNDCCGVPTQDCPPRCVAEISWEACAGEDQRATLTVKNTGTQQRPFRFAVGSVGPSQAVVEPTEALLDPGGTVTLHLRVPGNEGFKTGETYSGELLIFGAYEQCVCLKLRVAEPPLPHVHVSQGNLPTHIDELKWYRHWQCTTPCGDLRQAGDVVFRPPVEVKDGVPAAAPAPATAPAPRARAAAKKAAPARKRAAAR